jgi:hypothetical protein
VRSGCGLVFFCVSQAGLPGARVGLRGSTFWRCAADATAPILYVGVRWVFWGSFFEIWRGFSNLRVNLNFGQFGNIGYMQKSKFKFKFKLYCRIRSSGALASDAAEFL